MRRAFLSAMLTFALAILACTAQPTLTPTPPTTDVAPTTPPPTATATATNPPPTATQVSPTPVIPTPTPIVPVGRGVYVVTASLGVRVRTGPGTSYPVVGGLAQGVVGEFFETNSGCSATECWLRIGDDRWIAARYDGETIVTYELD